MLVEWAGKGVQCEKLGYLDGVSGKRLCDLHKTKEEGDEEEENGKDEAPEWSQQSKEFNLKKGLVKESGGPYEGGDDGRHEKS